MILLLRNGHVPFKRYTRLVVEGSPGTAPFYSFLTCVFAPSAVRLREAHRNSVHGQTQRVSQRVNGGSSEGSL